MERTEQKMKSIIDYLNQDDSYDEYNLYNWSNFGCVTVKPSLIPNSGRGVFATVNFAENDVITEYGGYLKRQEPDNNDSPYTLAHDSLLENNQDYILVGITKSHISCIVDTIKTKQREDLLMWVKS